MIRIYIFPQILSFINHKLHITSFLKKLIFDNNLEQFENQQLQNQKKLEEYGNMLNDQVAYIPSNQKEAKSTQSPKQELINHSKEIFNYLDSKLKVVNQQISKQKQLFDEGKYQKLNIGDAAKTMTSILENNIKLSQKRNKYVKDLLSNKIKIDDAMDKINKIITTPLNKGLQLTDLELNKVIEQEDEKIMEFEEYDKTEAELKKNKKKIFVERVPKFSNDRRHKSEYYVSEVNKQMQKSISDHLKLQQENNNESQQLDQTTCSREDQLKKVEWHAICQGQYFTKEVNDVSSLKHRSCTLFKKQNQHRS
eukprot:TRINITY_DN15316_c0_g1_i2.p1 TRINITY_DN15316_c0_g1~~TRINITY_DN15316_c0_g1_i2.p1  ORF type:complete len:309 (-),score=70.36 TRINITY_DN15316_c0_g1_i2:136-1062(-)